jgi:hypothetical protein
MVDRLIKVDSGMSRVLETRDDQGRGGGQQQEEDEKDKKKKDKYDKGRPFWKRLMPESTAQPAQSARARLASGERPTPLQVRHEALMGSPAAEREEVTDEEEQSVTLSRRVLVLWGVVDLDGRPRIPVIITYAIVAGVIAASTILIFGILFRGT